MKMTSKMKTTSKMRTTLKMKTTQKMKTTSKMRTTLRIKTTQKIKTIPGPSLHNLSCACYYLSRWVGGWWLGVLDEIKAILSPAGAWLWAELGN